MSLNSRMNEYMKIFNSLRWPMSVSLPPDQALYIYRAIEKLIQKSFKAKHKLGVVEVDFEIVKHCLEILKEHHAESRLMWKTIYLLFQYFEKFQNSEFLPRIADVLYFVLFDTFYARNIIGATVESESDTNTNFPSILNDAYSLEEHNSVWTLMKIPYRNDFTNIVPKEMNVVWLAAQDIHSHRLLPILLRQGLMYMPPSSHQNEWIACNRVLRAICCFTGRHLHGFDLAMGFRPNVMEDKLEAQEPAVKRRIFSVFRAMNIVQRKMSKLAAYNAKLEQYAQSNFVDRFRMIFDTIPEPLVTLQEVRSLLEKLFLPSNNNKDVIDIFCEWFERLMPESAAPLTPRSLKHLSRCQVRDNLRKVGKFPYEVRHLSIPETLKKEILLVDRFPPESFEKENKELCFFEEADNVCQSGQCAQQFFNRKIEGTSMLDIMNENYQRELQSQLAAKMKESVTNPK